MQFEKVIVMPDQNRKSRLRSEENPPYPEFAVEMVREFTKTISQEISPMRADVVGLKHSIGTLEKESAKQGTKIETIMSHVDKGKGALWAFGIILTILGGVSVILELVKYFTR